MQDEAGNVDLNKHFVNISKGHLKSADQQFVRTWLCQSFLKFGKLRRSPLHNTYIIMARTGLWRQLQRSPIHFLCVITPCPFPPCPVLFKRSLVLSDDIYFKVVSFNLIFRQILTSTLIIFVFIMTLYAQ